jgi:hypothetical protein
MGAPYKSAEDRIDEDDFEAVLTVLAGPSPWQKYIVPSLKAARSKWTKPVFQIVNSSEFTRIAANLGISDDAGNIPGVTDKTQGQITMQDEFGQNLHNCRLGHALHESVHLVSDPPGKTPEGRSSLRGMVADGVFEGIVEAVTEDILHEQKIALASENYRGHPQRVPVVRKLFKTLEQHQVPPVPLFGRLLFVGDLTINHLVMPMNWILSAGGWTQVQGLTTQNKPDAAIRKIDELVAAQDRQHEKEDEIIRRHFQQLGARWAQPSSPNQ